MTFRECPLPPSSSVASAAGERASDAPGPIAVAGRRRTAPSGPKPYEGPRTPGTGGPAWQSLVGGRRTCRGRAPGLLPRAEEELDHRSTTASPPPVRESLSLRESSNSRPPAARHSKRYFTSLTSESSSSDCNYGYVSMRFGARSCPFCAHKLANGGGRILGGRPLFRRPFDPRCDYFLPEATIIRPPASSCPGTEHFSATPFSQFPNGVSALLCRSRARRTCPACPLCYSCRLGAAGRALIRLLSSARCGRPHQARLPAR